MTDSKHARIDPDLVNLSGGAFDSLPQAVLPLEIFDLPPTPVVRPRRSAAPVERPEVWLTDTAALPLVRPRHDSLSPTSSPSVPPPPPSVASAAARHAASSRASRAFAVAIAAGAFGFGIAGALLTLRPQAASAPASAPQTMLTVMLAPDPIEPAPVAKQAEVKAAPPAAEAKAAPKAEPAPVKAIAPAPKAAAPAPKAAEAAPVDTADLPMPVIPPLPPKPMVDISRPAVAVAIANVGMRAASCREEGAGPVAVPVSVTFSPKGNVTGAVVTGGALAGTKEGACVASLLRGATVPAFDGDPVTVTTTVHLH